MAVAVVTTGLPEDTEPDTVMLYNENSSKELIMMERASLVTTMSLGGGPSLQGPIYLMETVILSIPLSTFGNVQETFIDVGIVMVVITPS